MAGNDTGPGTDSDDRPPSHQNELEKLARFGASRSELKTADKLIQRGWWGGRQGYPWNHPSRERARREYESGANAITKVTGFDWNAWKRDHDPKKDSPKPDNNDSEPENNPDDGYTPPGEDKGFAGDSNGGPNMQPDPDGVIRVPSTRGPSVPNDGGDAGGGDGGDVGGDVGDAGDIVDLPFDVL